MSSTTTPVIEDRMTRATRRNNQAVRVVDAACELSKLAGDRDAWALVEVFGRVYRGEPAAGDDTAVLPLVLDLLRAALAIEDAGVER